MDILDLIVSGLFEHAADRDESRRRNPVTGGRWVPGLDSEAEQKKKAKRALEAQAAFGWDAPPDAPQLPVSRWQIQEYKRMGGLHYITALYAQSLQANQYDRDNHPSFDEYVAGILALPGTGDRFLGAHPELAERYPPRPLQGLKQSGIFSGPED